ncbi:MAG TPA: enoyl-CoA hydratase, partial [Paracoccus sp.]|nr:enoyl-CoA hydratase [Paracoccus sp. (in: a-proteobacteria)]
MNLTDPSSPVLLRLDEARQIGTVTFNRPDVFNALDIATAAAFEQAVSALQRHAGLRCV